MRKLCMAAAVALGFSTAAHAVVIDFDGASSSLGGGTFIGAHSEDGFVVFPAVYSIGAGWQNNRGSYNGTTTGYVFSRSIDVEFSVQSEHGLFDLHSIDFAELFNNGNGAEAASAKTVEVVGYGQSSLLREVLTLDMVSDGIGGADDFQTFSFSDAWKSLGRVTFHARNTPNQFGTYLNFDNIVVTDTPATTVPLPAALPLLAGGLGVLCFMGWRRKRAA